MPRTFFRWECLGMLFAAASGFAQRTPIRRIAAGEFSAIPPGIVAVLRTRGCTVPQPSWDVTPNSPRPSLQNAIRGEFFAKGQEAWAVLCSIGESSSILVFRDRAGARPQEIAKREDRIFLQGDGQGKMVYSREIDAVGGKYIMDHFHAYGGPEPPPIDHQGIDDVFLGKASVTYYWYKGSWRQLTGAD